MPLVSVKKRALEQFDKPKLNEIYAYYRKSDEALTLVHKPDPDGLLTDERLGIDYVDRIHVPVPDTLQEYLSAVSDGIKREMNRIAREAAEELDEHWDYIKNVVEGNR